MADKLISLDDLQEFKTKFDEAVSTDITTLESDISSLRDMLYGRDS